MTVGRQTESRAGRPGGGARLGAALAAVVAAALLWAGAAARAAAPVAEGVAPVDPKHVAFFETRVRPLLAEQCVKCHGGEKTKGGLRLTSRAALLKGGETGPA